MKNFKTRLAAAMSELDLSRYMERNGYDDEYALHSLKMDLEYDPNMLGGIRPNDIGLRLLIKWWSIQFYISLLVYVITGRYHTHLDDDPMGDMMGRNV